MVLDMTPILRGDTNKITFDFMLAPADLAGGTARQAGWLAHVRCTSWSYVV